MTATDLDNVVGIDVGGANLKYAGPGDVATSASFALWRHSDRLSSVLAGDLRELSKGRAGIDALAVTMTGELADCFADRAVGVRHIVAHTARAAQQLGIRHLAFYGVDGRFHDSASAESNTQLIASANWHALAGYVGRNVAADGMLIDIGSTTTDLVPISDSKVATSAKTDFDRLREGSLVYVGCRRTPVCALVSELNHRGQRVNVMNELFATVDDARLLVGTATTDPNDCDTADGRPRTRQCATARLARMIGLDHSSVSFDDAANLAAQIIAAARLQVGRGLKQMPRHSCFVISGHGDDLLSLAPSHTVIRLTEVLGPALARSAPSHAVASLYKDEISLVHHHVRD